MIKRTPLQFLPPWPFSPGAAGASARPAPPVAQITVSHAILLEVECCLTSTMAISTSSTATTNVSMCVEMDSTSILAMPVWLARAPAALAPQLPIACHVFLAFSTWIQPLRQIDARLSPSAQRDTSQLQTITPVLSAIVHA